MIFIDSDTISIVAKFALAAGAEIKANDTTICYGTTATIIPDALDVTGSPEYKWYSSQTELTAFHTEEIYTTSNLTADITLYISVSGDNYCETRPGERKAVRLKVSAVCTVADNATTSCGDAVPFVIDVLENDIIKPNCTPIVKIIRQPEKDAANVNGNKEIEYTAGFYGRDSLTESTSLTHAGAIAMNGKAIYEKVPTLTDSYHGLNNVKIVKFTYKTDANSCLQGKKYEIVIVLTS